MKQAKAHEIIKELRFKKGISQKDLAERIGTSQQAIALLENGKRKLEFDLFVEILNKMETSDLELKNVINSIFLRSNETMQLTELETSKTRMLDIQLLRNFEKLNDIGKIEAAKRVEELTEIPRYTQKENTEN